MTTIKLNGDIQRYVWSIIQEKAQDDDAPAWSGRVLAVRGRTLTITPQNAQDFIDAFSWFSNMADDEISHGTDEEGAAMNRREMKCADAVVVKIMNAAK